MRNADNVKSILHKVDAVFTIFSVYIFTRRGQIAPKGWSFDNVEAAIAVYGDEEVYKWKLESELDGEVRVTINL